MSFLHYIIDEYNTWQAEAEAILVAVTNYVEIGERVDDNIPDNVEVRCGLDLPSVGRHLGFESRLVERLGQILCEGMPFRSVINTSETDQCLQGMLWCLTASLLSPEGCGLLRVSSCSDLSSKQRLWQLSPQVRKIIPEISFSPILLLYYI